jgi:endo-alpha-1,4-polygalactosaminidase (GH114 family)
VIAQNAEELLVDPAYRAVIDAVAKEDLLHGVYGTGRRNPEAMVAGSMSKLRLLKADGKPVFAVEYLRDAAQIEVTRTELAAIKVPVVFPTRALDGRDPLAISERAGLPNYGSPEYASARCNGVFPKAD